MPALGAPRGRATGTPTAADLTSRALDARGLVVAGIVVGVIGALGDVTVSQVSIVAALRQANPGLPSRLLYREARRVGRAHVTSAITTLALAVAVVSGVVVGVKSMPDVRRYLKMRQM